MSAKTSPPAIAARLVTHVLLLVAAAISVVPFVWLIFAAFKRGPDLFNSTFMPRGGIRDLTLANFAYVFQHQPFFRWIVNSIFLASTATVVVVALSSLGGFALAKYEFAGKRLLQGTMLATLLLPGQVLLPGSYELIHSLGWLNSYAAILVPGSVSVFGMFLFRQAMNSVPDELLQAGRVDGCSELRLWWDVALPVVRPMTGAFTLMSFVAHWNAYLWPQVVLQDEAKYTLPIGLSNMMSLPEYQTEYGALMAGTLLSLLPVMLLFFALQRDFISGLTSGAVKG